MRKRVLAKFAITGLLSSLLVACSSAVDEAKQEEIELLKAKVCAITKATGKDTVNGVDQREFFGYYEGISGEALQKLVGEVNQWVKDFDALEKLVGDWTDPDGKGWLKFCNL